MYFRIVLNAWVQVTHDDQEKQRLVVRATSLGELLQAVQREFSNPADPGPDAPWGKPFLAVGYTISRHRGKLRRSGLDLNAEAAASGLDLNDQGAGLAHDLPPWETRTAYDVDGVWYCPNCHGIVAGQDAPCFGCARGTGFGH